jgi:hypothetical protein
MGGTSQERTTQSNQQQQSQLTPGLGLGGLLGNLGSQIGNTPTGLTSQEQSALGSISSLGAAGNPFASSIGGVANTLLSGGGPDRTGIVNDAYSQYQSLINPTATGQYTDPNTNPFFAQTTGAIGDDVTNRLKSLFAGSGRDPSGAGEFSGQLGRGIASATAPIYAQQYQNERTNQLNAINNLFGAGTSTAGTLSGLDQTRLGNMQAGIGAADAANQANLYGPQLQLAAEAQRRGIPMNSIAQQLGLLGPLAAQFGTQNQSGTGSQTSETSSPFNPLSLLPLAIAPMTSGGGLGSSLFGQGFNWLTNRG